MLLIPSYEVKALHRNHSQRLVDCFRRHSEISNDRLSQFFSRYNNEVTHAANTACTLEIKFAAQKSAIQIESVDYQFITNLKYIEEYFQCDYDAIFNWASFFLHMSPNVEHNESHICQ